MKKYYAPVERNGHIWVTWINTSKKDLIIDLNENAAGWREDFGIKIKRVEIKVVGKGRKEGPTP